MHLTAQQSRKPVPRINKKGSSTVLADAPQRQIRPRASHTPARAPLQLPIHPDVETLLFTQSPSSPITRVRATRTEHPRAASLPLPTRAAKEQLKILLVSTLLLPHAHRHQDPQALHQPEVHTSTTSLESTTSTSTSRNHCREERHERRHRGIRALVEYSLSSECHKQHGRSSRTSHSLSTRQRAAASRVR